MAQSTSVAFADSYLSGAIEAAGVLTPKTGIACERLWERFDARRVLQELGVKLRHPHTRTILREPDWERRTKVDPPKPGARDYKRRPGENETAYARRLWPTREVKR